MASSSFSCEFLALFVSLLGLFKWSWSHLGFGFWFSTCSIALTARLLSSATHSRTSGFSLNRKLYIAQIEHWSFWALGTLGPLCLILQFSSTWWMWLWVSGSGLFHLGLKLIDSYDTLWIPEEHFIALSHFASMMTLVVSTPQFGSVASSLGTAWLALGTLILARPYAQIESWSTSELAFLCLAMANTSFLVA